MGAAEKIWVVHNTLVYKNSHFLEPPGFSGCWHHQSVVYDDTHCVQRTPIVKVCAISGTPRGPKKQKGISFSRELDIRVAKWAKRAFDSQRCAILMY